MTNAGLYARVSTDRQAEEGHSLPAQLKAAREWCRDHSLVLDERVWQDAESGRKATRAGYQQMLSAARRGEFSVLVLRDLSRFGRDRWETMSRIGELLSLGVEIHQIADGRKITAEDDEAYLLTAIGAHTSHAEVRAIRRNTRQGQQQAAQEGRYMGRTPIGYKKTGKTLTVDRKSAEVVRDIFRWYTQDNLSMRQIGIRLNATHRLGREAWHRKTISDILGRTVYKGEASWGASSVSVPAIIQADEWEAARLRRERKRTLPPRAQSTPYLLTGLIRCGVCNSSMIGVRPSKASGGVTPTYVCSRGRDGACTHTKKHSAKAIEAGVLNALEDRYRKGQVRPLGDTAKEDVERALAELDAALDQRLVMERGLDADLRQAVRNGRSTARIEAIGEEEIAAQDRAIDGLRAALEDAKRRVQTTQTVARLRQIRAGLEELPIPQQKAILQQLLTSVTVYDDGREVEVRLA